MGRFDHLIPKEKEQKNKGRFDHLIPTNQPQPQEVSQRVSPQPTPQETFVSPESRQESRLERLKGLVADPKEIIKLLAPAPIAAAVNSPEISEETLEKARSRPAQEAPGINRLARGIAGFTGSKELQDLLSPPQDNPEGFDRGDVLEGVGRGVPEIIGFAGGKVATAGKIGQKLVKKGAQGAIRKAIPAAADDAAAEIGAQAFRTAQRGLTGTEDRTPTEIAIDSTIGVAIGGPVDVLGRAGLSKGASKFFPKKTTKTTPSVQAPDTDRLVKEAIDAGVDPEEAVKAAKPVQEPQVPDELLPPELKHKSITNSPDEDPVAALARNKISDNPDEIDILASKVEDLHARIDEEKAMKFGPSSKKIIKKLKKNVYDRSANVKDELRSLGRMGEEAAQEHTLVLGTTSKAQLQIDQAVSKVYKKFNVWEEKEFGKFLQSDSTLDVMRRRPDLINPDDLTEAEHLAYLANLKRKDPEMYARFEEAAGAYYQVAREQLDKLLDEGLIDKELHERLYNNKYMRREYLDHIDPDTGVQFKNGQKISVGESGIDRLTTGSSGLVENDSRKLMADLITRTESRIMRNRANKKLFDIAQADPENGLIRRVDADEKLRPDEETINVRIDGQTTRMAMPKEFASEWVEFDSSVQGDIAGFLQHITGASTLRFFATGANPEFAVTNFFRDIAFQYMSTNQRSSFAPLFALQTVGDLVDTFGDTILRRGRFEDFINEGGGMNFLARQGVGNKFTSKLGIVGEYLGWLGETSEIWNRLALRERALKNGLSNKEATFIARNVLDFNQGGTTAKALDKALPYTNVAIQGTRGIARHAKDAPTVFAWKVAQLGALTTSLYYANTTMNKEAWESISDHVKDRNFIITTPFYEKDENGNKRHFYIPIPMDQGQAVFSTLFRAGLEKVHENKAPSDSVINSFRNAFPVTDAQSLMPPFVKALVSYSSNKDFWFNDDIWRGRDDISPELEVRDDTAPFFKTVAPALGLSPVRSEAVAKMTFTRYNMWNDLVGYGYNLATGNMNEAQKDDLMQTTVKNTPFLRRMVKTSPAVPANVRREIEEITRETNDMRQQDDVELRKILMDKDEGIKSKDDLKQFIKGKPKAEQKRLIQRWKKWDKTQNKEHKQLFYLMDDMRPVDRAKYFHHKLSQADGSEAEAMKKTAETFPGFFSSPEFTKEFKRIQKEKENAGQ
jgi:hypothetical protein